MKKITLLLLFGTSLALSQNYSLDTTFGSNGINYTANASESVKSIFATDNKILTTGFILSNNFDLVTHTVVLKKDGTPDQRFKSEAAKTKTTVVNQTAKAKAAEKKITDKETGKFRGKKLFTGPNGGKYYINSNGNKTYVK